MLCLRIQHGKAIQHTLPFTMSNQHYNQVGGWLTSCGKFSATIEHACSLNMVKSTRFCVVKLQTKHNMKFQLGNS
jgi:hypothetical protein